MYSGKCVVIITGASRGFGREIAELITSQEDGILPSLSGGSRFILMSRDQPGLEQTKELLTNVGGANVQVDVVPVDFSDISEANKVVNETLSGCSKDFQDAFLFSNAGVLGDPSKLLPDYSDMVEMGKVYNVNIVSPSYLIARFCKYFESSKRHIVNTSSLAALQPFRSTGLYSTCKAAMDMFLRNLVADCVDVRALNYAPGPLDTKMARDIRDGTSDEGTRGYFNELFSTGKILSAKDSAKKLMGLLRKDEFENGAHIDFYDV